MKLSIIIVSFNPGDLLFATIQSILKQTFTDYEIIVQDSCSTDGSIERIKSIKNVSIFVEKDLGIYDGMNKAIEHANGDFLYFLNCGDYLFENDTLEKIASNLSDEFIYYGDVFARNRNGVVTNPTKMTNYKLSTKTICHQTIFFPKSVFLKYRYNFIDYPLSADYELYFKCYKAGDYRLKHINQTIVNYDCSGTSEQIENRKKIVKEKRAIQKNLFSKKEYFFVCVKKALTLYYLKEKLGTTRFFQKSWDDLQDRC